MAGEKHISASELASERAKKRRRRRIVLTIVFIAMAAAAAAEVIVLRTMTSVDRRFIRGVERGVASGWESGRADLQLKDKGAITDTAFIDAELEAAAEFANKGYKDKELKKLARQYISDLKKCRAAASAHDPAADSEAFWDEFAEPYTDRLIILRELYLGDYNLGGSWDEYPEMLDEVLSRAWAAEAVTQLEFSRADSKNGIGEFRAVLQNDSGFDIEFINIDIEIYDSDDTLVGTAEVYKEDIAEGGSEELVFYYTDKKVASYRIAGVDIEMLPGAADDEDGENGGNEG